jgi:alanyl-tRNA synthetase
LYVESGGQIGDEGTIIIDQEVIPVLDLQKVGSAIAIKIHAPGVIKNGQKIKQVVDERRAEIAKNHTATHILQTALLTVLGTTIKQTGSLVTHDYLRFDFNYQEHIEPGMIQDIEELVNQVIQKDLPVSITTATLAQAQAQGVIAHFGEKYNPENVRIVNVEGFCKELCGGSHVSSTGTIGVFKITEVSSISAGMRRITGVTGPKALALFQLCFSTVKGIGTECKVPFDAVYETFEQQIEHTKELTKQVKQLKKQVLTASVPRYLEKLSTVNNIPTLFLEQADTQLDELRELADLLANKKEGLYVLTSTQSQKLSFVATISASLKNKLDLKNLSAFLQEKCQLRSGGSPTIIQGGGAATSATIEQAVKTWITGVK